MTHHIQMKDITLMSKICDTCTDDFTAHSFNLICNSLEGGPIFYTKISNASKYDDTNGIVKHCTNYLNYINPPDKWSWIIDFEDFGFKHTLGINTGIQLSKLINKIGKLKYLFVINTNPFVEQMLKMIKITLNKEYHKCIVVLRKNDKLKNNILNEWNYLDNNKKIITSVLNTIND